MIRHHDHFTNPKIFSFFFFITLWAVPVYAQDDEINRLQQKIADLELKVKKLENLLNESILIPKSDTLGWYNKKNWRKLEIGMSQNQVTEILGEPIKIVQGKKILWYYPNIYGGIVSFNENGYLINWNEP